MYLYVNVRTKKAVLENNAEVLSVYQRALRGYKCEWLVLKTVAKELTF